MSATTDRTTAHIRPLLRWAGSKRQLLPILSAYWQEQFRRYVEPFAGSARLFFMLQPPKAVLGDINSELISTYQIVRDHWRGVGKLLVSFRPNARTFYSLRKLKPDSISPEMKAARFIFLNRLCFNGLYRTNRSGVFNVPYGGVRCGQLPSYDDLAQYSALLKDAELRSSDFERTLEGVRGGDFVYMDPPYSIKAWRMFNEYDASVFDLQKIRRLREWMLRLDRKGAGFVVSYAGSDEAKYLGRAIIYLTNQD
jgi:DNA adenine methylase